MTKAMNMDYFDYVDYYVEFTGGSTCTHTHGDKSKEKLKDKPSDKSKEKSKEKSKDKKQSYIEQRKMKRGEQ